MSAESEETPALKTEANEANNKRKQKVHCCVLDCKNNSVDSTGLKFYSFPTDNPLFPAKVARREAWLKAVRIGYKDGTPWVPSKYSKICSAHFVNNEKSEDPRGPSYNPTIFPDIYKKRKINGEAALARYKRHMKRNYSNPTSNITLKTPKMESNVSQSNVSNSNLKSSQFDDDEVELTVNDTPVKLEFVPPIKRHATTQVSFLENEEFPYKLQKTFICSRYISFAMCDAEVQTNIPDPNKRRKIIIPKEELDQFAPVKTGFYGFQDIKTEKEMADLTGTTPDGFQYLLKLLFTKEKIFADSRTKTSSENKLLIFLMKMKCGLSFTAISVLFGIHRVTVTRIFLAILDDLCNFCKNFVFWPEKKAVQDTMPHIFKSKYSTCRVIIDYPEFAIEKPAKVEERMQSYSYYEKGYRIKNVMGFTPCGFISFFSKCYKGGDTNSHITELSGILDLLESDDLVIVNEDFPELKEVFEKSEKDISHVALPYNSYTEEEDNITQHESKVRFHIERMTKKIRSYKITDKISSTEQISADKILFACCALINMQHPNFKPE